MDKHRQMAVKVVHLSIPLLKGDLGIDVRDSCRKDRQLYLWHAELLPHSAKKSSLLPPFCQSKNRLISLPLPTYVPHQGIWSFEDKESCRSSLRKCRASPDRHRNWDVW